MVESGSFDGTAKRAEGCVREATTPLPSHNKVVAGVTTTLLLSKSEVAAKATQRPLKLDGVRHMYGAEAGLHG